jgi:ATP-dependent RNA helicase MSS116
MWKTISFLVCVSILYSSTLPQIQGWSGETKLMRRPVSARRRRACVPPGHNHHHRDAYSLCLTNAADEYNADASASKRRRVRGPIRRAASPIAAQAQERVVSARARHEQATQDPTLLTTYRFDERADLHPGTKRAVTEVMGFQQMTEIQYKTFNAALEGKSVLGRARTGTGKTLAFLLPAIERLMFMDVSVYRADRNVGILIVAPTRELAMQIGSEASRLLTFESKWSVLTLYGGTKIQRDVALLNRQIPTILVATPGRLLDHLEDTRLRGRKFSDVVGETPIVVLDETDRLLEGFAKDTRRILSFLPRPEKRQTLLFSATVPTRLKRILDEILPADYVEVDCVGNNDSSKQTNKRVTQSYTLLPAMDSYVSYLVSITKQAMEEEKDYKIVVFFPAARLVRFFTRFFNVGLGIPVLEMHSRMSQSARTRINSSFRNAKRGVLFTSDVSARGVDFPDVTLVVQYGAPSNKELYIHRLGRTGRAGREGKGLLVLLPFEKKALKEIDLQRLICVNIEDHKDLMDKVDFAQNLVRSGHPFLTPNAEAAYLAFVAYYMTSKGMGSRDDVVDAAKVFAQIIGLPKLPDLWGKLQ